MRYSLVRSFAFRAVTELGRFVITFVELAGELQAQPGDVPGSANRHQIDRAGLAGTGFEPLCLACGDVQSITPGSRTVELQGGVHRGEVVVRTDLYSPVTHIGDIHGLPVLGFRIQWN